MKFKDALQYMLKDKRVRIKSWSEVNYIRLSDAGFVDNTGSVIYMDYGMYQADWELYKDKTTIKNGDMLKSIDPDITDTFMVVNNCGKYIIVDLDSTYVLEENIEKDTIDNVVEKCNLVKIKEG